MASLLLCFALAGVCLGQERDVLCREGSGGVQAASPNGVTVIVGAARKGLLASRACEATLGLEKEVIAVSSDAFAIDLDAFAVDLGLGAPVAAFQVKKSAEQCCMEYQVYSLTKPPRRLRTLTGGTYFSAADTDLDGRVEIWTEDAASFVGFERLSFSELSSLPTMILRFDHDQLLDVSAEFQPYFDEEIHKLRSRLSSTDLDDFKKSDGRLAANTRLAAERIHHLRAVKAGILGIVWNYLYSGREPTAWQALSALWPDTDRARIQEAILHARDAGLRSQLQGTSHQSPRRKRTPVFDAISPPASRNPSLTPPRPILLNRPPQPPEGLRQASQPEIILELVIDSAGKVRTAEPADPSKPVDQDLLRSAVGWKFIPAYHAGQPVASRMRLALSPRQ